jgi:hypothetical protein
MRWSEENAMTGNPQPRGKALITGASRGIGRAICQALRREGYTVIGTCRDPGKLAPEETVEGVRYLPLDLTSRESIEDLLQEVREVDILVNNAGTSMIGPVEEAAPEAVRSLFELNFFGPLRLTQGFLGPMREKRSGTILYIGSMAAETGVLYSSLYAGSKAALRTMARTLRAEVREFGINVILVAPFHIRTTIPQERQFREGSPYIDRVNSVKESRDRQMAHAPGPDIVAEKILQVLRTSRPRFFYPIGKGAALNAFLMRHLPGGFVDSVVNRLFDERRNRR